MINNCFKAIASITLLFFFNQYLLAQPITVVDGNTTPYTPENLITNVFLGDGVLVTNVSFFGDPLAVGYFSDGLPTIGVDRGVVMSSGRVSSESGGTGIDNPGSTFASYDTNTTVGDLDLNNITGGLGERDVCKYVISFVPTSDTLEFNYVFASEEYPEYACSSFNDVFGFFISGPGFNGPYELNAENIALIPGTITPVSINNIHPQNGGNCPPVNEEFYVDNNFSNTHPVYDGYTQVFTARAVVTPCEEYTIKLAISDAGDQIFDSGVFLEAKSFGTGTVDVAFNTLSLNGVVAESCSEGDIVFSLTNAPESDFTVDVSVFGTATEGVDYAPFPSEFVIPAGETSISVPFIAFEDNIAESEEYVGFAVQRDPCTLDTFYLYIRDNELPELDLGPDVEICEIGEVTLMGELPIVLPDPPSFTNIQDYLIDPVGSIISSDLEVSGVLPIELGPDVIQSVCINVDHNWLSDLDIYLQSPDGLFMELVTDVGSNGDDFINTCFVPGATVDIDYIDPPANAAPYTGEFNPEGLWSDLGYGSTTNGTWTLLVIDDSEGFEGTLLDWTITFNPVYDIFYSWSPSAGLDCTDCPNPVATPDITTEYILEVTDSYGCTSSDTIIVEIQPALEAPDVSCIVTAPDCIEFSWDPIVGAIGYLVSVDNAPFIGSNGTTSHTVCGLNLNTEVQVEIIGFDNDCGGFSGFSSCTTPSCDGAIPVEDAIGGILCYGDETGFVELSATGTFPPFEFTLNGETNMSGDFTGLSAGIYTLDILDGVNCLESYEITIPSPDSLELSITIDEPISCHGETNAILTGSASGGLMPYSYNWSQGNAIGELVTNVGPGLLALEVTDDNGCLSDIAVNVEEPEPLIANAIDDFVICEGDDSGTASVIVTGGILPYTYEWDVSPLDTNRVEGLPSGSYSVVVTDAYLCASNAIVNITESAPIELDFVSTAVSCGDGGDGSLTVIATGGVIGIFNYIWDINAGGVSGPTASSLDVGTYSVTVEDLAGCVSEGTGVVASGDDIQLTVDSVDPLCWNSADGSAEIEVVLGEFPYVFTWSDAMSVDSIRNDLATGIYTVTVTDDNDCEAIALIEFEEQDSIELSLGLVDPSCVGNTDGEITVSSSGGSGIYTYDWGGGNTGDVLSNLGSGNYTVTVLDENLCSQVASGDLTDPDAITLAITTTDASCFDNTDGSADVVPSPGSLSDYVITWDDGQTDFTLTGLAEGIYGFTVESNEGCQQVGNATIGQPDILEVNFDITDDSCINSPAGELVAVVSGGTDPYNYQWDGLVGNTDTQSNLNQGTYSVTITDDKGCTLIESNTINAPDPLTVEVLTTDAVCFEGTDGTASVNLLTGAAPLSYSWSNNTSDPTASMLSAGIYTLTVTDFNDCTFTTDFEIEQAAQISVDLDPTNPNCFDSADGLVEVSDVAYGGISADPADFTFEWIGIAQNGPIATGLVEDSYTVLVTDVFGCSIEESIVLTSPAEMVPFIQIVDPVSCLDSEDGSLSISTLNGTAPFTYQWGVSSNNQTGNNIFNLPAGLHEVTITDDNGCTAQASFELEQPSGFDYTYSSEPVTCFGSIDGQATLFVEGSNNSYSYDWDGQNGQSATGLAAGTYEVTVTDLLGCSFVAEVVVESPEEVFASHFKEDVACNGQNNGMIGLEIAGGVPPYEYTLYPDNDNQADSLFENLTEGIYDVIITDSKGCEFSFLDIEIDEPAPLSIDLGDDVLLEEINTYVIDAQLSFETPILEYNWEIEGPADFGTIVENNAQIIDIEGRTYVQLQVVDENGCIAEDYINIFLREKSIVLVPTAFTPNNDEQNDILYVHGSEDLKVLSMQVFDRWGNRVFNKEGDYFLNDPALYWDGTFNGEDLQTGAYLWTVLIQFRDGRTEYIEGSTTLIR
jgi:gliding motility-associated-like protein